MVKKKKREPFWFEEPFVGMRNFHEEFRRMMRDLWRESWSRFPERFRTRFIPIRIGETDDELILRAELPGFKKDEIKLKVTPTEVYISAEKRKKSIEKKEKSFRMQRGFSSAGRVVSLPEEIKTEGAKARFEDGVLEITLKKKVIKKKEKEIRIE